MSKRTKLEERKALDAKVRDIRARMRQGDRAARRAQAETGTVEPSTPVAPAGPEFPQSAYTERPGCKACEAGEAPALHMPEDGSCLLCGRPGTYGLMAGCGFVGGSGFPGCWHLCVCEACLGSTGAESYAVMERAIRAGRRHLAKALASRRSA